MRGMGRGVGGREVGDVRPTQADKKGGEADENHGSITRE